MNIRESDEKIKGETEANNKRLLNIENKPRVAGVGIGWKDGSNG